MTPLEKLIAVFNRYRASKGELPVTASDYIVSAPVPYKGPASERNTKITLRTKKPVNGKYKIYYLYYNRINLETVLDDLYVARDGADSLAEILIRTLNDEMRVDFADDDFERVAFNDDMGSFMLKATSKNIIFTGSKLIIFEEFKDIITTILFDDIEATLKPTVTLVGTDVNLVGTITSTSYDVELFSAIKLIGINTNLRPTITHVSTDIDLKSTIGVTGTDVDLYSTITVTDIIPELVSTISVVNADVNLMSTIRLTEAEAYLT